VFRWSQVNGKESLEPPPASPRHRPSSRSRPAPTNTVRVRFARPSGRCAVRKVIACWSISCPTATAVSEHGQHPDPPVDPGVLPRPRNHQAERAWSARIDHGRLLIDGNNGGDERLRVASLKLRDAAGTTVSFGDGLAGYVLGRSSMTFTIPNPPRGFGQGGTVSIAAETIAGRSCNGSVADSA